MELSRRDKNVLIAGSLFLVLFCIVQFVYFPASDKLARLKHVYVTQDETLLKMKQMAREYQDLSLLFDQQKMVLKRRPAKFTLFSFLDTQAQRSGVKKHVAYMKPFSQETEDRKYKYSKVKVKLKGVYSKGLIDFLSRIESSRMGVGIINLSLDKSGRKGDRLDAVIEAQALVMKGDS